MSERSPETGETPESDRGNAPGLRIILWILLLYVLGYSLMVIEDLLNHVFI